MDIDALRSEIQESADDWMRPKLPKARDEAERKARRKLDFRRHFVKKQYGLTLEAVAKLLSDYGNCCAACWQPYTGKKDPVIDHDHETNEVRAPLCSNCNLGFGFLKEDPAIIFSALLYLVKHKKVPTIS